MRIRVICGDEACRNEFSAETEEAQWVCPECEREITNPHFPFLTARIMQASFKPDEADWEMLFQRLLEDVQVYFGGKYEFIFESKYGPGVREHLGEEALTFIKRSKDDAMGLSESFRQRFDDDWRKMHDTLLDEARDVAVKLWSYEQSVEEA